MLQLDVWHTKQIVSGETLLAQIARISGVPIRIYLAQVENLPVVQIQRKIIVVERRASRARVHQLNEILWTLKNEGIQQPSDFDNVLEELQEKAVAIQTRIAAAKGKQAQYQQVAKWLNTVETYGALQEQYSTVVPWRRKKFQLEHQVELEAYAHARERLQHYWISDALEMEAVEGMADQQRDLAKDFYWEKKRIQQRIVKLRVAQEEVTKSVSEDRTSTIQTELQNGLPPKPMSGEMDVSNIQL